MVETIKSLEKAGKGLRPVNSPVDVTLDKLAIAIAIT